MIFDLEIYNFYLMHLELFTRTFPQGDAAVLMVRGKMASTATDMANARIAVRLGLDQLAFQMAMTKDRSALYGASKVNIVNLDHFNETLHNLEDINEVYAHKNKFIQRVIERSIELRSIQELYKISRLNIGIIATGQVFSTGANHATTKPQIGINFSFGVVPQILYSTSLSRTAKIDVENQILNMINSARIAYDTYKYNFGLYVEARRSIVINRKAVKACLDKILDRGDPIDGVFLNSVIQLIDAHLKLNAAVHSALGSLAFMRRLMVTEEQNVLNYIPIERNINAALKQFMDNYGKEFSDVEVLDGVLHTVHSTRNLESILAGKWKMKDGQKRDFTELQIKDAVQRNMSFLLRRRWNLFKSKKFFATLHDYIIRNEIPIESHALETLRLLSNNTFVLKK